MTIFVSLITLLHVNYFVSCRKEVSNILIGSLIDAFDLNQSAVRQLFIVIIVPIQIYKIRKKERQLEFSTQKLQ